MSKYIIKYTDDLPDFIGGRCTYPLFHLFGLGTCTIEIRSKYKGDIGLLNHEIEHARQYDDNAMHVLRYKYSKKYRFESELLAYKMQILSYGYRQLSQCNWIIDALYYKYDLCYTKQVITDRVKRLLPVSM